MNVNVFVCNYIITSYFMLFNPTSGMFYGNSTVCTSSKCYTFEKQPMTYDAAAQYCTQVGSSLLQDTSQRDDVEALVNKKWCGTFRLWVGSKGTLYRQTAILYALQAQDGVLDSNMVNIWLTVAIL